MNKMKKTIAGIAALAALALGGAVFAQAQGGSQPQVQSSQAAGESANGPDGDTIQSGDQTTPDQPGAAGGSQQSTDGADQGAADAPDQGATDASDQGATDSPDQTGSESADQSDGPGGHADPAGNVDNQFEGQQ